MTFGPLISSEQSSQYVDWQNNCWHIVHSPELSTDWLQGLLDVDLTGLKKEHEYVLKLEQSQLVLKQSSDIGFLTARLYRNFTAKQLINYSLKQNPAYRAWRYAHYLRNQGFATAEPLAYMVQRKIGFSVKAWSICRFDQGLSCDDYFVHSPSFTPAMINTAFAIASLFKKLRKYQMSHGNLKATNILITENKPSLINLDSMKYHADKSKAEKYWRRDIERFMENWRERYDIYKQFKQAFLKAGINL